MTPKRYVQCLALSAVLCADPALAALPPAYQRAAELKAVIDAATEILDGAPIISVEYILDDVYRAYSEDCVVTVLINTAREETAEPTVGPGQVEAVADDPVCRPDR